MRRSAFRSSPSQGKVTDVALMTDGLESLALHYASKSVHEPFFHGMFQPLLDADGAKEINRLSTSLERFLSSERVGSRTDDDVSLILATCRQQDHQRMMQLTLTRARTSIRLGQELGRGVEGAVFAVEGQKGPGRQDLCVAARS